jgi:hypothetical protein
MHSYEDFLGQLHRRYGWDIKFIPRKNVGEPMDVPPEFRQRIARDNALDMELYELARSRAG